jgi:Fibroblast growth factor
MDFGWEINFLFTYFQVVNRTFSINLSSLFLSFQKDFTEDCIFNESMEQHHYNTYSSSHHSNSRHILYLGFNRHGQPRKIQIPATRPLGKLATYTKALTQTVPVERVDRVVGRLFGPNHVRHGLKQLCESGRSLQQLTAKVMKPKPKCNSSSSSNSNNSNSNSSNSNLAKLKKKKKKRRKCREDEPESDQCFKGAPGPMAGAKKKGGGMAQQKNQKNPCTDEECGATRNGPKRGPMGKKPNNGNRGPGGGGGMGPGGKKNKKPSGPMHKRMRMTSTTTPKAEEEDDDLEDDAMATSQEGEDDWEEGAGGAASLTSNFIAHDYEDPFQF